MGRLLRFLKSPFGGTPANSQNNSGTVDTIDKSKGLLSPDGLGVVASVSGEKSARPNFFDTTANFQEVSEPAVKFTKCGHSASPHARVSFWGREFDLVVKDEFVKDVNDVKTVEGICSRCRFEKVRDASIRCCLCGYGITPGEGVALYHKNSKGINKKVATLVEDGAVGCLLWDCCPSGGFFAGHWTFGGFNSAFEGRTQAEQVMSTDRMVISNA